MSAAKRARSASFAAPAESQFPFDDDSASDTDVDEQTARQCVKISTLTRPKRPSPDLETLDEHLTAFCRNLADAVTDDLSVPALFPDDFAAEVEGVLMGAKYAGTRHCKRVPESVLKETDFDDVLRLARELSEARSRAAHRVAERVHAYSLGLPK